MRLLGFFALLFAPSLARAACAEPVDVARLQLLVDDAEAAWAGLDTPAFGAAMTTLAERVPCLAEAPERAFVARYHRLQGLRAFAVRDSVRARAAFAASRRIEPAALLPTSFAPPGHPLQDAYTALAVTDIATQPAPTPVDGAVTFDATRTQDRPTNVPTFFQWRDAAGAVRTTAYVWPTEALPAYPMGKASPAPAAAKRGLLVGAAAGGAVALGLAATTAVAGDRYADLATPEEDLAGLRALVNTSGIAAIGLGAAAAGVAIVAIVVPLGN